MIRLLHILWLIVSGSVLAAPAIPPESVAILFNSTEPESAKLASFYASARSISEDNLIGLELSNEQDISRDEYQSQIVNPLRRVFDRRGWWKRQRDSNGILLPTSNQIRVIVTMRGVPLRIKAEAAPAPPATKPQNEQASEDPVSARDEAAVDSELAMFGVEDLPTTGVLKNFHHQSNQSVAEGQLPAHQVLTARIDARSLATCERMIRDAVEIEKSGLWGAAYVDIANKYPQGDQWLENVVRENLKYGIPTVVDRFNQTLPKNYPMRDAALYHGWYDWHVSGPFLKPGFRFRKGAVAMHLHSFSGEQLRHPNKNWSAALLERGAAVTIGNVYEPYLHLTHDFGILHERLLAGHSWIDACWMAMPVTSWQGIVLGDPLYRPFLHLSGSGVQNEQDRQFRALRAARMQWSANPEQRYRKLEDAARKIGSGWFLEAIALELAEKGLRSRASVTFQSARSTFIDPEDKLRQDLHIAALDRKSGRNDVALRTLRDAQLRYTGIPGSSALDEWIKILDPPKTKPKPKP